MPGIEDQLSQQPEQDPLDIMREALILHRKTFLDTGDFLFRLQNPQDGPISMEDAVYALMKVTASLTHMANTGYIALSAVYDHLGGEPIP